MKVKYFLLFLLIIGCEKISDYEKKENLRNLYIFLNLPDEEKIKNLCIESEKKAIECASTFVMSYLGLLNGFYQISITNNVPENYCPLILESSVFKDFSNDAKRCHFECNQKFWESANCNSFNSSLEQYSKCLPGIWIKKCEDQKFKDCLKNCYLYGTPVWFIE